VPVKFTVQVSLAARNAPVRVRNELARLDAWHVVHAVDGIDREAIEQALLHHFAAAAETFLGRLEDEGGSTAEFVRMLRQVARGAEQHGGVAVMAAGVHFTGHGRAVGAVRHLLDVERIEVGAQADGALAGLASLQGGDHAGSGDALGDVEAPGSQPVGDQGGGAGFLEPDLRVAMDILSDRDQFRLIRLQRGEQIVGGHENSHQ
jgi:hypothetical protein